MARRRDPRIRRMWTVGWASADGREHFREVWSETEARTLQRRQTDAGGQPIGEPVELEDRYGVRWRDSRGRSHKRVLSRERAAKDLLVVEDGKRARGESNDPRGARKTLAEVFEEQTASKLYAPATLALRRTIFDKHIASELGPVSIAKIDTPQLESKLADIPGPVMRQKARNLLGVLFRYAVEKRWLTVSPVPPRKRAGTRAERLERKKDAAKDPKYLTEGALRRLLDELPAHSRVLVQLQARMGLRPGEVFALTVGKLTPARDIPERKPAELLIDTSLTGFTKTGKARTLVLPDVVAEALAEHVRGKTDADPMFTRGNGSPIAKTKNSYDAWRRRVFTPAVENVANSYPEGSKERRTLEGFTPNHLRHSAAAFAVAKGANPYHVQRMLGHAKPSITLDVYGSLWDKSLEQLAEKLDEAIRRGVEASTKSADVVEIEGAS